VPVHPVERRLAAIFAADIAGYSRLMARDEVGTLARLKACRVIIDELIASHRGRIFNTAGDSVVADFASAVDAVQCAVAMQAAIALENAGENAGGAVDEPMQFRIGVHVGDVMVDGSNLLGDGVNIAARLEALAEPGGICCSGTVHDQIRDKLPYLLDDLGEQSVKNIARSVRVYALHPGSVADLPATSTPLAVAAAQHAVAPRLSIVVLPFANLSNDPEQEYFADGITEDLTTDLSRIEGSFVISHNTAFTYKGKPVDTKQIGRELGVRYVLEGSVRRSGSQIRINAQLIDAETDAHLWAERFTGGTSDLFALQDEITSRIAVELNLALTEAEAVRPIEHPGVLDYILRGRAASARRRSRETYDEAIGLLERALALDPRSPEAQSGLATALAGRVLSGMADSPVADIARAEALAGQALAAAPRSWRAHIAKGTVLRAQRRHAEAIPEYETVLALNRNSAPSYAWLGQCKLRTGSIEEAIPLEEQAIRLSPRDPELGVFYQQIGLVHLLQSRTEEAILWLEKARNAMPSHPMFRGDLAAAYALNGESERAAAELAEARRLTPHGLFSSIARLEANLRGNYGVPKIRALYEATYVAGLRKAGMPEE
jgi:adenylate cyclase